jgi:hypothetical protein
MVKAQTPWLGDGRYVKRLWERSVSVIVSLLTPHGGWCFSQNLSSFIGIGLKIVCTDSNCGDLVWVQKCHRNRQINYQFDLISFCKGRRRMTHSGVISVGIPPSGGRTNLCTRMFVRTCFFNFLWPGSLRTAVILDSCVNKTWSKMLVTNS